MNLVCGKNCKKTAFLQLFLTSKQSKLTFSVQHKSQYLNAIAYMLFDASNSSIFDSAIFVLLFFILDLHWLMIPKFVNNHRRNCTENRSIHLEVFCRKGVLRNFAKSTENHQCLSLFLNKDPGHSPETY